MSNKPYTWDDYHQGRQRHGSSGSQSSGRIQFAEDAGRRERGHLFDPRQGNDRTTSLRRKSSVSEALGRITQAGGVNSIGSFARSWQRAVSFHDITPGRGSYTVAHDEDNDDNDEGFDSGVVLADEEQPASWPKQSLLKQQIEQHGRPRDGAGTAPSAEHLEVEHDPSLPLLSRTSSRRSAYASPFSSSHTGGGYGTVPSPSDIEHRRQATKAFVDEAQEAKAHPEGRREPLLLHQVEQSNGKVSLEVVGQSTIYQTILNSTNVLVGAGILSLPLGIKFAGWLLGCTMLTLAALATAYTARLLAKCLDVDKSVITYSDIALIAYGKTAEIGIGMLFTFELAAACVALVVLFGDSLHLLVPDWGVLEWKVVAGLISLPLSFLPLRYLGVTSMLGVISCFSIVVLVFAAGLSKQNSPGSLLDPAVTHLFPESWMALPLSLGLMMSPWGGHAVFPQLYRDMRHPKKYGRAVAATFSITYLLDIAIAIIGLLMFGDDTRAEITSNILEMKGYPRAVLLLLVICIAIIPITKLPLAAQPIFSVIDNILGLSQRSMTGSEDEINMSKTWHSLLKIISRVFAIIAITVVAIFCPGFDRVMSFMGSLFCMLICICFPVAFYLKLYGKEISIWERAWLWAMGSVAALLAIVGTVWAFLPSEITHS